MVLHVAIRENLTKLDGFLLVIDEAQNIKNRDADQTRAIKAIKAKCRIAMSGTPVENRLLEFFFFFFFLFKLVETFNRKL